MSKYNYFDDEIEEENEKRTNKKRTKVKIDLSPVINKLKKIEAGGGTVAFNFQSQAHDTAGILWRSDCPPHYLSTAR